MRKGQKHSRETRLKMSNAAKGRVGYFRGKTRPPMSEEQKIKIGLANKGKPSWNKGKEMSEKQYCNFLIYIKKGRKERKMTNLQSQPILDFPTPKIGITGHKEITNENIAPNVVIVRVIWESLLGVNNEQLIELAQFNNSNFVRFVENTRKDFKSEYKNLNKYPSMEESDWE